jgi:excisionase family DNA binding protein
VTTYETVAECAVRLRLTPATVRRYCRDGRLKAIRAGRGYRVEADAELALAVRALSPAAQQTYIPLGRPRTPPEIRLMFGWAGSRDDGPGQAS